MAAPVSTPVPIDQRFAQLIQQFGLTKNSFAISLGKTASVIQHLIDGRNKPGYDLLCKVFEIYPNVSRDWLLLGRGPMLVSSGPAPKSAAAVAAAPELPDQPLAAEPLELPEIEVPPPRRPGPGVAGTQLQPADIAATLALAAAVVPPVAAAVPLAPAEAPPVAPPVATPAPVTFASPPPPPPPLPPAPPPAPAPEPAALPAAPLGSPPGPLAPPVPAGPAPEVYVAAALHAQHLQHQLTLAELRNHHLLEQQQMLREMLAMARQAMV